MKPLTHPWLPALALLVTFFPALPRPAASDSAFRAAYAEADITPPLGGSMPGYFTDRKAAGVLDPLKAKALVLRKGNESIALVACDLVGIGHSVVQRIRDEVARQAAERKVRAPGQVWVHATHTHTGGLVPRDEPSDARSIYPDLWPGEVDQTWVTRFVERAAGAVVQAASELKEEKNLTLHEGREETVAHYRRYLMRDGTVRTNPGRNNPNVVRPAGEIDPRVTVLRFGSTKILMVLYGLHPDCVGGARYSADYPAHMTDALRESLGSEWRAIFFNAACGNINHIDIHNPDQRSGPQESTRIGRALAGAVEQALKKGQPLRPDVLKARTRTVACTLRRPTPEETREAEEKVKAGVGLTEFNGLQAPAVLILARTKDREHQAEISALRIGSFGLAFMPGEIFVELAREVEAGSPFKPTRTIGLTNGAMGYIPNRQGYAEGGYEAGYRSARYVPGNGHNWAAAAAELLRESAR